VNGSDIIIPVRKKKKKETHRQGKQKSKKVSLDNTTRKKERLKNCLFFYAGSSPSLFLSVSRNMGAYSTMQQGKRAI